jgi:Protein of unknown function (DUF2958)
MHTEFGTVSLEELGAYRGRLGLGIERDLSASTELVLHHSGV